MDCNLDIVCSHTSSSGSPWVSSRQRLVVAVDGLPGRDRVVAYSPHVAFRACLMFRTLRDFVGGL